jgi:SAM-dependent methyltransferase
MKCSPKICSEQVTSVTRSHPAQLDTRSQDPLLPSSTSVTRMNGLTTQHFDDPVAAYDRLAQDYARLADRREAYLRGMEKIILSRIPRGRRSLLDVGAGNGARALHIAAETGIGRVVLLEPSAEMVKNSAAQAEVWPVRAENVVAERPEHRASGPRTAEGGCPHVVIAPERFDVVTCLWNVLGHIPTQERLSALRAISNLLSPDGKLFLDVNHRYNLRSYGIYPTIARWTRDRFFPDERNGDVTVRWNVAEATISTYGHVFTHREIMRLADASGLELEERVVVDYEDGRVRRFAFMGNLLYIFRRSSRMDSSSAPETS